MTADVTGPARCRHIQVLSRDTGRDEPLAMTGAVPDRTPAPVAPARPAWIIPGRLAVAERPGRGGRSHRRALREDECAWWAERGVRTVVSGMRSRHGLAGYAAMGWEVHWHPLGEPRQAVGELPRLVATVRELLERPVAGPVLVHCDRPGEVLAAVDAALRLTLGLARDRHAAFQAARADGLPVGSLTASLVGQSVPVPA